MNKNSICILAILIGLLVSCKDNEKDKLYDELNAGLENSNNVIENSNQRIFKLLYDKQFKSYTYELDSIWYPKAMKVKGISDTLYQQLEEIKKIIQKDTLHQNNNYVDEKKEHELYINLIKYKKEVLSVDSEVYYTFNKNITITSGAFDSTEKTEKGFNKTFLFTTSTSAKQQITCISKLQNNIKLIENAVVTFCNAKVSDSWCGYIAYQLIANQNTNHLKAGDSLEITAGLAGFSLIKQPKVFINNIEREPVNDRVVVYKMKASGKYGKHYVPIMVKFQKEDGTISTLEKQIEYTVDE